MITEEQFSETWQPIQAALKKAGLVVISAEEIREKQRQAANEQERLLKACIMAEKYFEALLSSELDDYTVEDIIWTHDELKDAIASAREL